MQDAGTKIERGLNMPENSSPFAQSIIGDSRAHVLICDNRLALV